MTGADLTGTTAVVTGSGGGLGKVIAEQLLTAGATVVAHSRRQTPALDTLARNERVHIVLCDLRDARMVESLFSPNRAYGPVTVLVNNAGSYPSRPLLDMPSPDFEQVITANLGITHLCLLYAARCMRANGGGSIVNIGSLNASRPAHGQAAYNSAKAAILSLTRSAALELAPYGIRVNAVSPGLINRPKLSEEWPEGVRSWVDRCPMGRVGEPREVADACIFLASSMASWITGQELVVDGGISASPAY